MRTLYVHIGHCKTGSSYLQSLLSINSTKLQSTGLLYPDHLDSPAARAEVSIGNGMLLLHALEDGKTINPLFNEWKGDVLFSSEWLFEFFCPPKDPAINAHKPWSDSWEALGTQERLQSLILWSEAKGFDRIRFLLFIRNPIEHFLSFINQRAKDGGILESWEAVSNYNYPQRVLDLMIATEKVGGLELQVQNYSKNRNNIRRIAEEWLGSPRLLSEQPVREIVNRSLTSAENILQLGLAKRIGWRPDVLIYPLCHGLPHILADSPGLEKDCQDKLKAQLESAINFINARLPMECRYEFDSAPLPAKSTSYTLDAEQLTLIGDRLGGVIKSLEDEKTIQIENLARLKEENNQIGRLEEKNTQLMNERRHLRRRELELNSVLSSWSWRITSPLRILQRAVIHLLRRFRGD